MRIAHWGLIDDRGEREKVKGEVRRALMWKAAQNMHDVILWSDGLKLCPKLMAWLGLGT